MCRSAQFTISLVIFLGYVPTGKKKKKRDNKLKKKNNNAEPYGLASSSRSTVKISKTGSESDNNNARNSINRKKSRKSRLNSKNDTELKEKRKLRRVFGSEDEDDEHAMERKKSRGSRRSDSKLSDSDVKSVKPNWYDKLENMDNNLQEALRVNEIFTQVLFNFCDI